MFRPEMKKNNVGTVLIVDDEPSIRETLGSILGEEGYSPYFAENGHDGYEKARELIPDLILLDVTMPRMNGLEVCRKIRGEEPPLKQVPIIIITALGDVGTRFSSIKSGADDFLSKPFDLDELLTKVKNITKDNCFRELPPERESRELAHGDLRDYHDATVEGWANALELPDTRIEGNFRRDTVFTSSTTGTPGETPGNRTGGAKARPNLGGNHDE